MPCSIISINWEIHYSFFTFNKNKKKELYFRHLWNDIIRKRELVYNKSIKKGIIYRFQDSEQKLCENFPLVLNKGSSLYIGNQHTLKEYFLNIRQQPYKRKYNRLLKKKSKKILSAVKFVQIIITDIEDEIYKLKIKLNKNSFYSFE